MRRAPALLLLLLAVRPAAAAPLLAEYSVHAAGLHVMEIEALLDLDDAEYLVRTHIRTTGLVGLFSHGDQVTEARGTWQGVRPVPDSYRVSGTWRGSPRQVVMDYLAGMPMLRALVPPNNGEREAVPAQLQRDTVDALSALAWLSRTVAATGRCDALAPVFDGRRRADYASRTIGVEALPQQAGYAGQALRCALETRLIAGRLSDQDPMEAERPQPATAWLARVPSAPLPIPVRIELPSRWFGTIRAELVHLGIPGQQAVEKRG
jgi:hypothetical protein